jgi:hypothetical protein
MNTPEPRLPPDMVPDLPPDQVPPLLADTELGDLPEAELPVPQNPPRSAPGCRPNRGCRRQCLTRPAIRARRASPLRTPRPPRIG